MHIIQSRHVAERRGKRNFSRGITEINVTLDWIGNGNEDGQGKGKEERRCYYFNLQL